jgi:non-heme chloroperoxidase
LAASTLQPKAPVSTGASLCNAFKFAVLSAALSAGQLFALSSVTAGESAQAVIRQESFLTSDGVRLQVLEAGPAEALVDTRYPVIAFVPGWSMPARVWQPQLETLGRNYRVAALDPRGQGASDLPAEGFNINRRSEDVREFVARYPRVVLVAWSLGALEALHFLHRHGAGRVAGLVIVDSSVGEGQPQAPAPAGTTFTDELRRDRAKAVDAFVQAVFRRSKTDAELAALRDEALRMPLEASLSLFPSSLPRTHWRRAVHEFKRPLLYVVTPQFSGQALALRKNRPGTRIAVFNEAGHALFADEPARFNQLLSEFLAVHRLAE